MVNDLVWDGNKASINPKHDEWPHQRKEELTYLTSQHETMQFNIMWPKEIHNHRSR